MPSESRITSARSGEAAGVKHAERGAGRALGLEVRQLPAADGELVLERLLRPARVAGDPVEPCATLGKLAQHTRVELQLVGARRAEGERVEHEDRALALQVLLGEARPVLARQLEGGRRRAGSDHGHLRRPSSLMSARYPSRSLRWR